MLKTMKVKSHMRLILDIKILLKSESNGSHRVINFVAKNSREKKYDQTIKNISNNIQKLSISK